MRRSLSLIERFFEPVVIVSTLAVLIVLIFADVVARFAFATSIPWANEVARFAFVYMIYFGVSYAIRENRHLRVGFFVGLAPPRLRRAALLLAEAIFLLYSLFICYLGVVITANALARGQILSATQWPTATLYAAIVFSGALSAVRLVQSIHAIATAQEVPTLQGPGPAGP